MGLVPLLGDAGRILVFTGAGISTGRTPISVLDGIRGGVGESLEGRTEETMQQTMTKNGIIAGTTIAAAAALLLTLAPAHILAQPGARGGPMGGRGGMIPGLRQLNLTNAQRGQLRTVREQHHDEALAEQLRVSREALNEAIMADVVNESTIRGLAAQIAPLEADAAVQRAYANAAVLQVLTPDQRAELRELQAEAQEGFSERRQRRRERR